MSVEASFRSKCATCGDVIEEGDAIVKDEDDNWVHEDCCDPHDIRFNLNEEDRGG